MVEQCCVDGCLNFKEDITYFKLPVSRTLRKKWLDAINSTFKLTDDAVVCSRHFLDHHYTMVRGKKRLKPKVVPSVFDNVNEKSDLDSNKNVDNHTINTQITNEDIEYTKDKTSETIDMTSNNSKEAINKTNDIENENENSEKAIDKTVEDIDNRDKAYSIGKKEDESTEIDLIVSNDSPKSSHNSVQSTTEREFSPIKDIEDIITNYQIKQTRPLAEISKEREIIGIEIEQDPIDLEREEETKFVEVAVQGKGQERDEDCLLLLENVQVEVDPSLFDLEQEQDISIEHVDLDLESNSSDVIDLGERKELPISLLSSSDEDDVIIQEPKIDIVEVSDATDEDDIPLLKLAKIRRKMKKKSNQNAKNKAISKIISFCKYKCLHCNFTTNDTAEYKYHINGHSNILHCCKTCSYTTSSKLLLARHKEKHAKEKKIAREKKYKCPLCNYRAKHSMSLVYHMGTHEAKSAFECEKCGFFTNAKETVLEHLKSCGTFQCDKCSYSTTTKGALTKHLTGVHSEDSDRDVGYVPG